MANIVAQMQILISAQTKGLNAGIQQAANQFKSFETAIQKTNSLLTSFGVGFGLFQVTNALIDGVNILADFEKQMDTVAAITGATGAEFKALEQDALALGKATKFTATEVAELQTEYGRLGFTTDEILAATKATLQLAVATGEDLAKSADVAGSTVRGFGLNASETQRVVDVMAESFNKSALSLDNFSEAMKFVAPIAKAAGATVEETTALLGTLADSGIRGSNAGTALRKIFSDLSKDGRPLAVRLKELGDKGLTLSGAFDEVGRTAQTALLVLANNVDKTDELTKSLNNAAGAAQEAADIMGDNLRGDLDQLSSAYEGLILSENAATSALRTVTQAATDFLNSLSEQDDTFGQFLDFFGNLISVVPRAAKAISDFFTSSGLSVEQLNAQLSILNEVREKAIQRGDRETELKAVEAISKLTNQYKLLTPAVEESNKPIEKSAEAIAELPPAIAPALGLIPQIEEAIAKFEEAKKKAFSVGEINDLNIKIDDLKNKLADLNIIASPLSGFGQKQLQDAVAGAKTQIDELTSSTLGGGFLTSEGLEVPPLKVDKYFASLVEMTEATKSAGASAIVDFDQMRLAQQLVIDKQQLMANSALELGEALITSAARGKISIQSLVQIAAQAALKFIKIAFQQSIAGVTAGAAKTTAPPPVILALAALGIAGISAIFSKIGGPSGSGGGGASSAATRNVQRVAPIQASERDQPQAFEFVLHGNDLVASQTTELNRRLRLGR